MRLDPFTSDTLRSMVRYIADDRRIARHLRIDEKHVRIARTYVARRGRGSLNSAGVVRRAV